MTVGQLMDNMESWEVTYWQALLKMREKEMKEKNAIASGMNEADRIIAKGKTKRWHHR